ncbi:hypothetical protein WPS_19800 [Vulcanimicrobium alpinum]|uniref:Tail specific protease domain-containing protein n=1 Tax=Vulcanimicrobium alpinum TaxID=3016050 RepID=A0AAN2C9V6_UNVUL|nr:S41 family peptidase [Vulcanimicrobium alpinum]BDE06704.1 hypothetical protein WPS_19800 [Vulcanimicrobium alpinum]
MKPLAVAVAACAVAAATPCAADAPGLDAARIGAAIRAGAQAHFGFWDSARHAAFSAAWRRYRATASRLGDRDAVDLEAIRLVAALRNGRTWFADPAFEANRRWRLPFALRYADGVWFAAESRSAAIPDGAVLREIDGVPAERFFSAHRDLLFASSEAQARTLLDAEMHRVDSDARAPRLLFDDDREFVPAVPANETAPARVTFRWLSLDRVGYIVIPSFADPADERDALNAVKHFIAADAIVVDVRGNDGGATPVDLLELITDRVLPWWRESTNAPKPARRPIVDGHIPPADGHYRGRVVIVADERCASSCEDFVMPLVASQRARFVGARTYGSAGDPYVARLDGGITLAFGSIRAALPGGAAVEGVGIPPTDPVALHLADVRAHADAQLERAVAIAERPQVSSAR